MRNLTERCNQTEIDRKTKLTRREALPLLGGIIAAPTILTGCSSPTESEPFSIPGTIAFEHYSTSGNDIYITNWNAEEHVNLTEEIPGKHGRPFWSPDGLSLYFDSEVDGTNSIYRITDLANPSESLEKVVDEPGHQFQPIVHPDGDLLVYHQKTNLTDYYAYLAAYDLSAGEVLSMSSQTVGRAGDNNQPTDKEFVPDDRKVLYTGINLNTGINPNLGVFDPDTGTMEPYGDFQRIYRDTDFIINTLAISSTGTAYGTAMTAFDWLLFWDVHTREELMRLDLHLSDRDCVVRQMVDVIETTGQDILLLSARVTSNANWRIAYIDPGKPTDQAVRISTVYFPNMSSNNYWPRHTFIEHVQ